MVVGPAAAQGRGQPSCVSRSALLVRAACFDVVWHVFRGPRQGTGKSWTQLGLALVVSLPTAALLLLVAQGVISDLNDHGPNQAAGAAILSLHAGLELASFAGVMSFAPGASNGLW